MATIKENLSTKTPVKTGSAPKLANSFGQAPIQAAEKLTNTVAALAKQSGDINQAYAVKNKRADMLSDGMKYERRKQEVMAEASLAASRTTNVGELDDIYANAKTKMSGYATGKNDDDMPNIRWGDQVQSIKDDHAAFEVQLDAAKLGKKEELYVRETIASTELAMSGAVRGWNKSAIHKAGITMVTGGHMTPAEGKKWVQGSLVASDKLKAKATVDGIAAMLPEVAKVNAAKAIKNVVNLDSLTELEQDAVVADINKAVQLSEYYDRRDAAAAKKQADASSTNLVNLSIANRKDPAKASQLLSVAFPKLTAGLVQAQTKRANMKDSEDPTMRTSQAWHVWAAKVGAYQASDDKDAKKLAQLSIDAMSFGGFGDRAMETLHRVTTGEGAGSLSAGDNTKIWRMVNQLTDDYIASQGWKGKGVPDDFKDPAKDKNLSKHDKTISDIDRSLFNLITKVAKQTDMDLAQAVEYIESDPLYRQLRDGIDVDELRRKIRGIQRREAPTESPL